MVGNGQVDVFLCTEVNETVIEQLANWPTERLAVYSSRPDTLRQQLESRGIAVNSYSLLDALLRGQMTLRNY